ncbi:MAG: hypothetical protein Q7S19_02045 [bacterium]|nr:hypothetical protein [bacterium]
MQKINGYLERFKRLTIPNEEVRKKLLGIIEEVVGVQIEIKDILIKNKIAHIKTGAMVKSEIFLNKRSILDRLIGEITDIK